MSTPNTLILTSSIPTILVSTQISLTTSTAIYTVGAGKAVRITQGSICNTSGAPVTCGLSIVPSGGTLGDGTHKVIADGYLIAAGDTVPLQDFIGDHWLGDGDLLAVKAGTANALDIVITGLVVS